MLRNSPKNTGISCKKRHILDRLLLPFCQLAENCQALHGIMASGRRGCLRTEKGAPAVAMLEVAGWGGWGVCRKPSKNTIIFLWDPVRYA